MTSACKGGRFTTPAGMLLDGSLDALEAPPDPDLTVVPDSSPVRNQMATAVVDYLEFYLLNYFKPAVYEQTSQTANGRTVFDRVGCGSCHLGNLQIDHDRRVADLETVYDPQNGIFNGLFATAAAFVKTSDDGSGLPSLKRPMMQPYLVK